MNANGHMVPKRVEPSPIPPCVWMTAHQAAEYLGLSYAALAEWRMKGVGPVFSRAGRLIRYRLADLDEYLSSRVCQSTSQYQHGA